MDPVSGTRYLPSPARLWNGLNTVRSTRFSSPENPSMVSCHYFTSQSNPHMVSIIFLTLKKRTALPEEVGNSPKVAQ